MDEEKLNKINERIMQLIYAGQVKLNFQKEAL